jgi:hypothetical protein
MGEGIEDGDKNSIMSNYRLTKDSHGEVTNVFDYIYRQIDLIRT